MNSSTLPLAGLRVVDFTWYAAGPYATKALAEHGAEVVKVETALRVDPLRQPSPAPNGEMSTNVSVYNIFNPDKLSITLDLNHDKGPEIARRLIAKSDVVVENFTPDVMSRWGLSYPDLVKVKPDIIMASMPVMGSGGPHTRLGGFGFTIESSSGLCSLTGFPGRDPVGTGTLYADFSSNPYHTTTAILAALHYRRRTGLGQHIELSQVESTVCFLGPEVMDYTVNGREQGPVGNRHAYAAPHGAYRCAGDDRWVAISVWNDGQWQALCAAMGCPPWTTRPEFATHLERREHEDELDRLIEEWTSAHTREEVMFWCQQRGVAAGSVQDCEDLLLGDPHMRARGHYVVLDHPEAGRTVYDGLSYHLSRTPGRVQRYSPLLGEHNDYVYREILGMSEEEINQCYVDGVFQ